MLLPSSNAITLGSGILVIGLSLLLTYEYSNIQRRVRRYRKHRQLVKPFQKYSRVPHITKYNYDRLQDTNGYLIKYHFYQSPSYKMWGKKERSYYLYVPSKIYSKIQSGGVTAAFPVIFVFHGTNGRATRYSGLWQQPDGQQSLLKLAEEEEIILVFGNATTWVEPYNPTYLCTGWLPGGKDVSYVEQVLNFITADYPVDTSRVYAIGHSNGGMFISDLVVSLGHRFAAAVNHMGGIATLPANADQVTKRAWEREKHVPVASGKHKVPLMIVTSHKDDNRPPCLRAKTVFEQNGWDVTFVMLGDINHAYWAEHTPQVWEFLRHHKLKN